VRIFKIKGCVYFLFCSLVLCSCTVQKPFYSTTEAGWEKVKMPDTAAAYTVYLVGGLGDERDSVSDVLDVLHQVVEHSDSNHAIIFLGDHTVNNGLPSEDSKNRHAAEIKMSTLLDNLWDDKGSIYFIPGDHSMKQSRNKRQEVILRTRNYVENELGKKNIFLPEDGCAGPEEVHLPGDLVLVILNTNWWLGDKEGRNRDCENVSESQWIDEIKDVLDNNQRKNIIMLGHHPLLNVGNHGGYFSFRQHLFPLTDLVKWLYLPFPIVGSIYPLYRAGIGSKQDLAYPPYKKMRRDLFFAINSHQNIIYASAHEHSLQSISYNGNSYLITNSSSQLEWAGRKNRASFSYSEKGFIKLSVLKNKEIWMEIYRVHGTKEGAVLVFRKRLKENIAEEVNEEAASDSTDSFRDSTITIAANDRMNAGAFKKFFLGEHWRKEWVTPVEVPVLDFNTEKGGLEIIKKGGGFQTQSLVVRAKNGEEYSLRSVTKYTERILGRAMEKTWVADIVRDQTSSTHPYAPYVIDDLSESAGVLHTNPKLVYIPDVPQLAEYRKDFANTLALFEQRSSGKIKNERNFGSVSTAISTEKMMKEMRKDNGVGYDEYLLLKSRLFDMWINDWDRHQDQWRWGKKDCADNPKYCDKIKAKEVYYVPIPRDRDQAFAKFDGVLPWISGRKWVLRKFQDFTEDIRDIPGFNFNARNLDHALLTALSKEEWLTMARQLQGELSNNKIEHAIKKLPPAIYALHGTYITSLLEARRDNLVNFAERYYDYLAKEVDVLGTDGREYFEVHRINSDSTSVKVFTMDEDQPRRLLYFRIFKTSETKEIRLYGMGGNDVFDVSGYVRKGILVRIVGGEGYDSINDRSMVKGWGRKTKIYDTKRGNILNTTSETANLTSNDKHINDYDFDANNYDLVAPATFFGYNVDDGLFLGGGVVLRYQGFRKRPYANYQRIVANTALKELIFNFQYTGDFNNVMGKWGIAVDFTVLAPKSTTNFFGLSNESVFNKEVDPEYYRLRFDVVDFYPAVKRHIGKYQYIKAGPAYQYVKIENTPGHFISSSEGHHYITDFSSRNFAGARFEYEFQNIDDTLMTLRGIRWTAGADFQREVKNTALSPVRLKSELSVFIPMPNHSVLACRVGGARLLGDFEFYQANVLGGQNVERGSGNLRGTMRGRYSGRSAAYINTDLRIHLLSFRTYLFPASFGVLGFYDNARVWADGENSDTWHKGYGWGIWINPFGKAIINLTRGISENEKLYTLNIGFLF
jgi:hypothetical protein